MPQAFGLPLNTKIIKRVDYIDGYKIISSNKSWHGSNVGWNIWIGDKKFFKNSLKREDAIQSALKDYRSKLQESANRFLGD